MIVDVYRNLKLGNWSIRNRSTGTVAYHSDFVIVQDVTFVVQPAGRAKVLRDKTKNVHAFVRGTIGAYYNDPQFADFIMRKSRWAEKVFYNPYKTDHFCFSHKEEEIKKAAYVILTERGGAWAIGDDIVC